MRKNNNLVIHMGVSMTFVKSYKHHKEITLAVSTLKETGAGF